MNPRAPSAPLAAGPVGVGVGGGAGWKGRRRDWVGRWTVLIQQHMLSGERSSYPRRYYGRWNEAHPFPAARRMTCGTGGSDGFGWCPLNTPLLDPPSPPPSLINKVGWALEIPIPTLEALLQMIEVYRSLAFVHSRLNVSFPPPLLFAFTAVGQSISYLLAGGALCWIKIMVNVGIMYGCYTGFGYRGAVVFSAGFGHTEWR